MKYCPAFRAFVKRERIEVIRLPLRSPNLNAYAERWVRSVRESRQCADHAPHPLRIETVQ
jgi:hypothetical protein